MKYQAVIFDLWGTLIERFPVEQHRESLSVMAPVLSVAPDELENLWKETAIERVDGSFTTIESYIEWICQRLGRQAGIAELREAKRIRLNFISNALAPRIHAIDTLRRLKNSVQKTGLITVCSAEIPLLWHQTDFAPLLDATVFSCSVALTKPDPRIYRLACQELSVEPEECLYIGDGGNEELTGAAAVGMHAVLISVVEEEAPESNHAEMAKWQSSSIASLDSVLQLVKP